MKIFWDLWVLNFMNYMIPQTARRLNLQGFQEFWSRKDSINSRNKGLKSIRSENREFFLLIQHFPEIKVSYTSRRYQQLRLLNFCYCSWSHRSYQSATLEIIAFGCNALHLPFLESKWLECNTPFSSWLHSQVHLWFFYLNSSEWGPSHTP